MGIKEVTRMTIQGSKELLVVESGTIHLNNGQFNDVLCVLTLSCYLLSLYHITHSGEGKIV